jgi:hypothetical protein
MKKLLCKLFGHRSICLFRYRIERDYKSWSEYTGWKCERCNHTYQEQWDA